jgi:Lamin Tail Domain/Carboxypeptidase regulatory-like domain
MKSILVSLFAIVLFAGALSAQTLEKSGGYIKQERQAISTTVVINEVYGGAGCGTAGCSTYQNDFIEIKNVSGTLQNIGGWSVQYTSATGSAWQVTTIPAGTILRPGDTYLIAESFGANGVNPLPTPNVTGTIAMSATAGKVALVNNSVALVGTCPTGGTVVDFVGYGATANCNGSGVNNTATNAPVPSTTLSDQRNATGTDTDVDSVDFTVATPTPQASLQPTAATASIGGRVVNNDGNGIAKVYVTLVDGQGNTQMFITNGFGYFAFDGLQTGTTYTISVQSKQYRFNPATRAVTLEEDLRDMEFRAEP